MYRQLQNPLGPGARDDLILRESDQANIPADPLNGDWRDYQAWLAAGNSAAPPAED